MGVSVTETRVVGVSVTEAVLVIVAVSVTESVFPGIGTIARNKTTNNIIPNKYDGLKLFISFLLLGQEISP